MSAPRLIAVLAVASAVTMPVPAAAAPDGTDRCLNLTDAALTLPPAAALLPTPILFVTQLPISVDLASRFTPFGNHLGQMSAAGRGGDLWLLHPPGAGLPQGCLRNLTQEAGFGVAGELQEGDAPIAVREPRVHWDGERALVSIVKGAPTGPSNPRYYWQIHEVSGFSLDDEVSIVPLVGQPQDYNNVSPIYGATEGVVYFTSDMPRSGSEARHLYPQQDEYERYESVTGLWRLETGSGKLELMSHTPSGTFSPLVDSAGRVIVSRWDHLQRDIFHDRATRYASEHPNASRVPFSELFPEPHPGTPPLPDYTHPVYGEINGHRFKHFFLWQVNADGSEEEIVNHAGRHEFLHFIDRNFTAPGNGLEDHANPRPREQTMENMLQPEEDPRTPYRFLFVDAPHFFRQSSGRLMSINAPPGAPAHELQVTSLTHPDANRPDRPDYDGDRFRDPLPLDDAAGSVIASWANPCNGVPTCPDNTHDTDPTPEGYAPNYRFRLMRLQNSDGDPYLEKGQPIAPIIRRRLRFWGVEQDRQVVFDGEMSQLDAAAVRITSRPPVTAAPPLAAPEANVFAQAGVNPAELQRQLAERNLALIVVRNATTRDIADRQQPFNLRVADSGVESITPDGDVFELRSLQMFQADLVSGHEVRSNGRRPLAVPMHDVPGNANPPTEVPSALEGAQASVLTVSRVDGSIAAFVPARRALSWQLTDAEGYPVVRERYWVTFQPGEVRVCTSCHGPNQVDQLGRPAPQNEPDALRVLLRHWLDTNHMDDIYSDGMEMEG